MDFIENLVNNSTFYYILVGVVYVLCIIFVVMLLVNSKRKRSKVQKVEPKKELNSVDLESVLEKMQEEASKPKDEIMTFEEEQEEKAIISYQELLNAVKKNVNEVTKVEIKEIKEEKQEEPKVEMNVLEPVVLKTEKEIQPTLEEENKSNKFQNSEFISPIFGRVGNDVEYPKIKSFEEKEEDLEKTIVLPKTNGNVDSNDEFLRILKEFRNNLE